MNSSQSEKQLTIESEALEVASIANCLQLTYEQRIEAHENARILMEELKSAGEKLRAKSQRTS